MCYRHHLWEDNEISYYYYQFRQAQMRCIGKMHIPVRAMCYIAESRILNMMDQHDMLCASISGEKEIVHSGAKAMQ